MKITKKIFNKVLFASVVAIVFALFNRCQVKAQVLEYTIPRTPATFSYDLDTDTYPYYIGNIQTNVSDRYITLSLYYFDNSYIEGDAYQYTTCVPIDSGYPQNPCYMSAKKQSNTNAYMVYYRYSIDTGELLDSNVDSPTFVWTYNNVILSYYNYSDYIENVSGFEYINNFPVFETSVGWVLSDSITSSQSDYTLTPEYIADFGSDDFDIDFSVILSSDNSNEEFNDDNHITGAGIAINYFPKDNSEYNYYYYWEPLDNFDDVVGPPSNYNDWVKLENSDKGIGALSVHSNGYVYAIITDKDNNLLSSASLKFDKFGTISLIPVNNNKISTYLTKISDRINYGGPISSILTIPINFISNIYNSFSGSCRAFNLGALLGVNIVFPCFTLESILGSSITNIIDMLCSFFIYYHLILFIISIYRKIMNLDDLDDYMPQHLYHPKHGSYEDYNG